MPKSPSLTETDLLTVQLREAAHAVFGGRLLEVGYGLAADKVGVMEEIQVNGVDYKVFRSNEMDDLVIVRRDAAGDVHVGFTGSRNAPQWFNNFKLSKSKILTDEGTHRGFAQAFKSLEQDVRHLLVLEGMYTWDRPRKKLYVYSHSRGKAFAEIFLAGYGSMLNIGGHVSFGGPACLSMSTAWMLDQQMKAQEAFNLRFVNNNDIVPGPLGLFGYRHSGDFRYIDSRGWVHRSLRGPAMGWDKMRGRVAGVLGGKPFDGWRDHGLSNYTNALSAWRKRLEEALDLQVVKQEHRTIEDIFNHGCTRMNTDQREGSHD